MRLAGVFHVLCTPFDGRGELDLASLRRLTETVIGLKVDGLTVLGVMGEAHKLTGVERSRVLETVMEATAGRVPVVVGASHNGTVPAVAASREAAARGAAAVMVAAPTFLGPGEALTTHLRQIADEAGLPIVLQDYPAASGVDLPVPAIAALIAAVPAIAGVKLEGPPTARRTRALLDETDGAVSVLGGLSGLYLIDELRHGASGTMTGLALPEALVDICADWRKGDTATAVARHVRLAALLVADGQPAIGLALRKHIWARRGVIASPEIRSPGVRLTELEVAGLHEVLHTIGLGQLAAS